VSNSIKATRTAASGTIAITSFERPATAPSAASIAARTASRWRRLFSTRSGTTLPGASSRAVQTSSPSPLSAKRPASTRSAAISQASFGLAVFEFELIPENAFCQTTFYKSETVPHENAIAEGALGDRSAGILPAVAGHLAPARRDVTPRPVLSLPRDSRRDGRRYRIASMNVTLLISFSVVMPSRTLSSADSRRNRMPSSRAARRISDVGFLPRIISRMRSLRSSSS